MIQRPVCISLTKYRFPVTAIASILHRISGVLLFLAIPLLLFLLQGSLQSEQQFSAIQMLLQHPAMKFSLWIIVASVVYHFLAGIRHLLMDIGIGESLAAGRSTAFAVIILSILLSLMAGVYLW